MRNKNKKKKKHIQSSLLSLCLIISMLVSVSPISAVATTLPAAASEQTEQGASQSTEQATVQDIDQAATIGEAEEQMASTASLESETNITDEGVEGSTYQLSLAQTKQFYHPDEFEADISWHSDDSDIAAIDGTGKVTATGQGTTMIYVFVYFDNGGYESYYFYIEVVALPNATYFFENVEYGDYMQVDKAANPMTAQGANFGLWDFDGENYQKFSIEYVGDLYYKIVCDHSGKVLTAPSSSGGNLTQTTYTNSDTQKWYISVLGSGACKLYPKSNDSYCMAAGNSTLTDNGRNVEVRTEQANDGDGDAWNLIDITKIYGNQQHRVLTSNQYDQINCHGYAMLRNDAPMYVDYNNSGIWCYRMLEYCMTITEVNENVKQNVSEKAKADFEEWLTEECYVWSYEPDFSFNGESNIVKNNQYRVVLRTGINLVATSIKFDYHFWYQTFDGTWSNKHGTLQEVHLEDGITPFSPFTSGWNLDYIVFNTLFTYNNFYDGEIYSYIITLS